METPEQLPVIGKFLPLAATVRRAIQRSSPASSGPATTPSFVGPNLPCLSGRLPDIYTTWPELLHFQPLLETTAATEPDHAPFDPCGTIIRPLELGFVPTSDWPPHTVCLRELRQMYFTRRNGMGRQFDFKLHNALLITKHFPDAYEYVGAVWVSESIIKINAPSLANLLGIQTIQGGLFHKQGNFSRYGFSHVLKFSSPEFAHSPDCADVDDYNVRLFTDESGKFMRDKEFQPLVDWRTHCSFQ